MVMSQIPLVPAKKWFLILLHLGFLLIGIITVLLGQILPILSARLTLNDREAGYLFIAQFVGSLSGTIFYNRMIKRFGYKKLLFGSFCLMAFGCAALNLDSLILTLASVCFYGLGIGLAIPTTNLLIVELNQEKSSGALNTINFFWGLGAIFCKPFVDYVGSSSNILLPTMLLSILSLLCGLTIVLSNYQEVSTGNKESFSSKDEPVLIWSTKTAWLIAIINFIQIGIESSVGGWITTFESRLIETSSYGSAYGVLSAALTFFLFLVLGRGIAPLFFRFVSENTVLFSSLIIMTAGTVLLLRAEQFTSLAIGAAILGFGCSSVFPTNMSRFTKLFGMQATKNAAPLFILGSLGGAFMTWFVGVISTVFNNLRLGLSIILIGCILLLILQIVLAKNSVNYKHGAKICEH
jgi:fucose permease